MTEFESARTVLSADVWETVNRELFEKLLAEFMYEDLVTPTPVREDVVVDGDESTASSQAKQQWTRYRLTLTAGIEYRFDARDRLLDSYRLREGSIMRCERGGEWEPATDPVQFLLDAREYIGIEPTTAAHLVREYNNTLVADAYIHTRNADREVESLLELPYAAVEGEMTGHPWFTYNKGRVGFGYDDYREYAPECKQRQQLSWIGARRDRSTFTAIDGLDYTSLLDDELGPVADEFRSTLAESGLEPSNYYFLPVHDWQWNDSIVQLFASEIATDALVPLGTGPDDYLPQQSIRTFSNVTDPEKRHVKLPIRVLNTNVYRGLLGEQAEAAPRVTEFITSIRDEDPFLRDQCDVILPGEVASINYEHPKFSQFEDAPYQFHELLGCLWRESVCSLADDEEQPITLAALLHEDLDGKPVASRLAARSGLSLEAWLDQLFEVLLDPLLHFLYKYGTVFMPHGTNVVLICENSVPSRVAIKDFVDEVAITERELPELREALPATLRDDQRYKHHILHQLPPEPLCQHIFGTLFVGVFRYISELLTQHHDYSDQQFWTQVRTAIEDYQARFPSLESRFDHFDLFRPQFTKHCLNRNRIVDYGYGDFSTRPKVRGHGTVSNPLSAVDSTAD